MTFATEQDVLTEEHMNNPQEGDRFNEHYSFWVWVVGRQGNQVHTREFTAGTHKQNIPRDYGSVEEFKRRFSYEHISGYWIAYIDNKPFPEKI